MPTLVLEKRREERFPVTNGAQLKIHSNGSFVRATAVDVSSAGLLVQFNGAIRMKPGDQVTCDIDDPDADDHEATVGTGRVIRIQCPYMAIQYTGALFSRLRP